MELFGMELATVITVIGYVIGLIVGYTKLRTLVSQNEKDIKLITQSCERCKDTQKKSMQKVQERIQNKFDKLSTQLSSVRIDVNKISNQLSKLTGTIQMFLKNYNKDNDR